MVPWHVCDTLRVSALAGTMFELVQALNVGAESLKKRVPNAVGLTAGCELFIGFVTLFPHESAVSHRCRSSYLPHDHNRI
jgi:hypothetical protein